MSGPSAAALEAARAWGAYEARREVVARARAALPDEVVLAPMKGAWLVETGRAHPADRPMRDVDLLVAGASLADVVRHLARAGFDVVDVPRNLCAVAVAPRDAPSLWLDLHDRPLPLGLSDLDAVRFLAGSRAAHGLALSAAAPAAVQLVGNLLKDRVLESSPKALDDLGRLLAGEPDLATPFASLAAAVGLARPTAVVLAVLARTGHDSPGRRATCDALAQAGVRVDDAEAALDALDTAGSGLERAARARALLDRPSDRLLSVAASVLGRIAVPIRARGLAAAART